MRLSVIEVSEFDTKSLSGWLKTTENHYSSEQLEQLAQRSDTLLLSAVFNEGHIGAVVGHRHGATLKVEWFGVRAITRRRGVGRYLLAQLKAHCQQQQVTQLMLPAGLPDAFYQTADLHPGNNSL